MVLRRQAGPGRAHAARTEAVRIDDLGDHQAGPDRADDRDLHQPPAELVRAMEGGQLPLDPRDRRAQLGVLLAKLAEHLAGQRRKAFISAIRASSGSILSTPLAATRPNSAAWPRMLLPSCVRRLSKPSRTPSSIWLADCSTLLIGTSRSRTPRTAHRLADRLGIVLVVLPARRDVGFHALRRDQHHTMAQPRQLARPMVRRSAGF